MSGLSVLVIVLTGSEHGLSKTTKSSSTWISLIGFAKTGVSCLQINHQLQYTVRHMYQSYYVRAVISIVSKCVVSNGYSDMLII